MTIKKKSPSGGDREGAEKFRHPQHTNSLTCPQDAAQDFKTALDRAGLSTKEPVTPDGKLHRFQVEGDKAGKKNGWYVLYSDGLFAGAFGCWKRQISESWCSKSDRQMTAAERAEFKRRMIEARVARETEEAERRRAARDKALYIWKASPLAPDSHPYLVKKRVCNYGLRLHKGALVIPMRDSTGNLHSLQFIDSEGHKRFLSGGRKKGCYFAIGVLAESLCIAEGYATAATLHESTGLSVAVAFDAGNLMAVALAIRAKFPTIDIILCADNDTETDGNPGLTKAREAAAAVNGLLAVPTVPGDFNDLYRGEHA
ncbi:MAG: toprim domain-containing protein [Rhodospirillales bacterium]|nr:toprim domain-containing protein [Rhodospirillales bacterium]MCB9979637.1 toprim domain-containing protein [Rhodospirillales bacterium]